jgi:enoyl-CoA hydratase
MATEEVIITERRGALGIVNLNRPETRNALNLALRTGMQEALEAFDADPAVRVVVLTGAGGTFCSGRDLKAAKAGEPMYASPEAARASFSRRSIAKPVIAAVEGYALGGGFELALSCDLIVAAEGARFGLPEVKRNLVAIGGGLLRLPRRMPYHLAMQIALTGDQIGAECLARWGIVSQLVPDGQSLEHALTLADSIAANGPSAVRGTKEVIRRSAEWPLEADGFEAQLEIAEPAMSSPDHLEGINAFLERRAPVWTDL